jgi:anti-sigma factor RsiW
MSVNWEGPWFHPAAEKLLRYVEAGLSEGEMARVRAHVGRCARCAEEVRLATEGLNWLGKLLRGEEVEGLEGIRARLIAEVRGHDQQRDLGECARLCLGPRSFSELARRLRRFRGGTPSPAEVATPMLAAFLGRRVVSRGGSLS